MRDVLQNTARKFFVYMADSATPTAAKTGLSSFTVYLAKSGGAENTVSPTITERGHGWYEVTPTTSHRDTLGENAWTFTATGAVDFPYKETVVAVDDQVTAYGAVKPTTPGNTLDVSAAGNVGIDWANIEAPTTAVNLSGTTILTATEVETDTQNIQTRLPAGLVSGRMDSSVGAMQNNVIVAAAIQSAALNGKGDWATNSQVSSLQVNTRANMIVPVEIETPDSGTAIWKIRLTLFDVEGNMEAPDITPTISIFNAAGTNRSSRLSAATNLSTGVYEWSYTSTAGDAEEQLIWTFVVQEGALTRQYSATSYVVEETAYRFTSSDRSTLNSASSSASTAASQTSAASIRASLGLASANLDTQLNDAKTILDRFNTMIVLDGAVYQYTANALELGPAGGGGGGGGDATLANQVIIIDQITAALATISALELTPTTIVGFPDTLTIGDDYSTTLNNSITIYLRDSMDDPITGLGSKNFADADFAPELYVTQGDAKHTVKATLTWVPAVGPTEGYLRCEFSSDETRRAMAGVATMQLVFIWTVDRLRTTRATQAVTWIDRRNL